jgi:hypothetical protein
MNDAVIDALDNINLFMEELEKLRETKIPVKYYDKDSLIISHASLEEFRDIQNKNSNLVILEHNFRHYFIRTETFVFPQLENLIDKLKIQITMFENKLENKEIDAVDQ